MAKARPLTPKQQRFVAEYLLDLNGAAAARRAGYAAKNAGDVASQLLSKTQIAAAIATAKAGRAERVEVTADDVLRELKTLGFSDVGQVLDFSGDSPRLRPPSEIPESARRAIASVKVKRYFEGHGDDATEVEVTEFKLWDKIAALVKLGQHIGMFPTKVEHAGKVQVELTNEERAARIQHIVEQALARRPRPAHA